MDATVHRHRCSLPSTMSKSYTPEPMVPPEMMEQLQDHPFDVDWTMDGGGSGGEAGDVAQPLPDADAPWPVGDDRGAPAWATWPPEGAGEGARAAAASGEAGAGERQAPAEGGDDRSADGGSERNPARPGAHANDAEQENEGGAGVGR